MTENLMSYARVRKESAEHPMFRHEVPVESWLSLPMPTRRWGQPGYARFACPAIRRPRQPLQLRGPDRWWLLGAERGELLVYGRTAALPFGAVPPADATGSVAVPQSTRPAAAALEELRLLDEMMQRAAGPFFSGQPADDDATLRVDLREIIRAQVAAPEALGWYRALTPDFFSWLDR
jgi:hypothetical protein